VLIYLPPAGAFFANNFKQLQRAACFVFFFALLFQEPVQEFVGYKILLF
jgi:hypothetical protein